MVFDLEFEETSTEEKKRGAKRREARTGEQKKRGEGKREERRGGWLVSLVGEGKRQENVIYHSNPLVESIVEQP